MSASIVYKQTQRPIVGRERCEIHRLPLTGPADTFGLGMEVHSYKACVAMRKNT